MCRVMSEDIKPKEDYSKLKKHIQINLDLEGHHTKPIMRYKLRDEETNEILCEDMEIIRIDIPYYYKRCYNKDANELEKLMGLIYEEDKNRAKILVGGNKDMEDIYDKILENSENIIGLYDKESHDKETRKAYMEEKIEDALNEKTIELVRNMLKENADIDFISRVSGLSIDEIKVISSKVK